MANRRRFFTADEVMEMVLDDSGSVEEVICHRRPEGDEGRNQLDYINEEVQWTGEGPVMSEAAQRANSELDCFRLFLQRKSWTI
ncbi:hypothetical protein HOLleu_03375 [Holothuria leucospilota]|uniref:Uncharacterized protein n=1 Tax=Holothuria leucospilota TaxID=206669 RepID=A0A9Q1CSS0_HOLLE|nr:hypothetical protein HOLleu_03375 [Holothuria leucospilota]